LQACANEKTLFYIILFLPALGSATFASDALINGDETKQCDSMLYVDQLQLGPLRASNAKRQLKWKHVDVCDEFDELYNKRKEPRKSLKLEQDAMSVLQLNFIKN